MTLVSQEAIDEVRELPRRKTREQMLEIGEQIDRLLVIQEYLAERLDVCDETTAVYLAKEYARITREVSSKKTEIRELSDSLFDEDWGRPDRLIWYV